MNRLDRYLVVSLLIWLVATIDAVASLLGYWSVIGAERNAILMVEVATLTALLLNAVAITTWVFRHCTDAAPRTIAWLVVLALLLCIGGDVVNFNLPDSYYRHGELIKHDYLVDSVMLFGPGYLIVLICACWLALGAGLALRTLVGLLAIGAVLGVASFLSMHLVGTGATVTLVTASYAVLISMVGASGVALWLALRRSTPRYWLGFVCSGLVLAAVADGVIGQLWIYGNGGEGYFPMARYLNWIIYIGSQSMLIHLARISVWQQQGEKVTNG